MEALALQQDVEKLHAGSSSSPWLAAATMIPATICPAAAAVHTDWNRAAGAAAAVAAVKADWQVAGQRRRGARGSRTSPDRILPAVGAPDVHRLPASQQSSRATRTLRMGDVAGLPLLPTLNGWLLGYPVAYLVRHCAAPKSTQIENEPSPKGMEDNNLTASVSLRRQVHNAQPVHSLLRAPPRSVDADRGGGGACGKLPLNYATAAVRSVLHCCACTSGCRWPLA